MHVYHTYVHTTHVTRTTPTLTADHDSPSMGAAASVSQKEQLDAELAKPVDASDVAEGGAVAEVQRLRGLLATVTKDAQVAESKEAPAPPPVEAPPASVDITDVPMAGMPDAMKAAVEQDKKWPMLLDSRDGSPAFTFLQYQHHHLLEMKKAVSEVSIKKTKTVEDKREEFRQALRDCMLQKTGLGSSPGRQLWMHFANCALNMKGQYCDEATLPAVMFDCAEMQKEDVKRKFLKDEEAEVSYGIFGDEFGIFLTSSFSKEDLVEFMGESLPLEKFKILNIVD